MRLLFLIRDAGSQSVSVMLKQMRQELTHTQFIVND